MKWTMCMFWAFIFHEICKMKIWIFWNLHISRSRSGFWTFINSGFLFSLHYLYSNSLLPRQPLIAFKGMFFTFYLTFFIWGRRGRIGLNNMPLSGTEDFSHSILHISLLCCIIFIYLCIYFIPLTSLTLKYEFRR